MLTSPSIWKLFVAACLIVYFPNSVARNILAASSEESAARADLVAEVRISKSAELREDDVFCGYAYEAMVTKVLKGPVKNRTKIKFGYLGGLEPKNSYRLYLKNDPAGREFTAHLRDSNAGAAGLDSILKTCQHRYNLRSTYFRADRQEQSK